MTYSLRVFAVCISFFSLQTFSVDNKYIFPNTAPSFSSYGNAGLLNMPNARFMDEGSLGFKWSRTEPYMRGSIIAYPFSWMETLYRYTDINDRLYSDNRAFSGGQSLKDKGFDAKFKLLNETPYFPAIAIGFRDLGGTNRFASEYIVASKFINNIDFTFGAGWGILGGGNLSYKNPLSELNENFSARGTGGLSGSGGKFSTDAFFRGEKIGIFGGMEYFFPRMKGLRFKAEYDSTNYEIEGERPVRQRSSLNYGIVYPIGDQVKLNLGYVRGNTIQLGFSIAYAYGRKNPLVKKQDKHAPVKNKDIIKMVTGREDRLLYLASLRELNSREFFLQSAQMKDETYQVVIAQPNHISYPRVVGRVSRILDDISPEKVKEFKITSLNSDFETYTVSVPREIFNRAMPSNDYTELETYLSIKNERDIHSTNSFVPKIKMPFYKWGLTPALRNHVGGPDGFYFGQFWLRGDVSIKLSRALSITGISSIGIADNFENLKLPSDSILPHVRTDIVDYLKKGRHFSITRLQLDYIKNPAKNLYTRFSAGIFEEMFAGIGGEILYRPFESNYAIGAEIYDVKQRDFKQRFKFQDYQTVTGHINLFYEEPRSKILFKVSGGRYLAEDSGLTFDFSRRFKSGLYMGAFFSLTDISEEEFGEGSFDKGFYFSFPIEIFLNRHSSGRTYLGLKPLTRDGAARLITGYGLWGVTDQNSYNSFIRDIDDIYD